MDWFSRAWVATVLLGGFVCAGELRVGTPAPVLRLDGDNGALVTGGPWSSDQLRGRVFVLFYVDPDEKDLNEHVGEALQRENFPSATFGTVAVINMAATWMPNWVLGRALASKQKKYPRTVYIKDFDRVFVKEWGLRDNSYDIVVFDGEGVVRFTAHGKLTEEQLADMLATIETALAALP